MNPFEMAAKAKELEAVAKEVQSVWHIATTIDADLDGVVDSLELLAHLKELPELIKKEGSEIEHDADAARKEIGDKLRAIMSLVGEDVEAIQQAAAKDIASLQAHAAKLQ